MTHVDCKSKVRLVIRSFLHPYPKSAWHSGMRSCIMTGLPTYSVQELDIGTAHMKVVTSCKITWLSGWPLYPIH